MELYYLKVVKTILVITFYLLGRKVCYRIIDKTLNERFLQEPRGQMVKRIIHILFLSISLMLTFLIWGVNQADLTLFIGSVLTVVGVAFFAQWSILSNVTSSIILFFNHPIRLNDSIMILENKDYVLEGKVIHIGLFFITLETSDKEEITLPNNIFIQKSIKKVTKSVTEEVVEINEKA